MRGILFLLLLLATALALPMMDPMDESFSPDFNLDKRDSEQYYLLLCRLYGICNEHDKEKRLSSSPFHGIPKFGKRAFTSAFSGIPKFG